CPSLLDTAGVHKLGGERCKSRADAPRLRLDETPAEVPPLLRVNLGRLSLPRDLGEAPPQSTRINFGNLSKSLDFLIVKVAHQLFTLPADQVFVIGVARCHRQLKFKRARKRT